MYNHLKLDDRSVFFEISSYIHRRDQTIFSALFVSCYRFLFRHYSLSYSIVERDPHYGPSQQLCSAFLIQSSNERTDINIISRTIIDSFKSPFVEIRIDHFNKIKPLSIFKRIRLFFSYLFSNNSIMYTTQILDRSELVLFSPFLRLVNSINLAVYHDMVELAKGFCAQYNLLFIFCLKDMSGPDNAFLQSLKFYSDLRIFTSQHASYRHFNQTGQITFNEANVLPTVSDYFLCWGYMVADFITSNLQSKAIVAGPPVLPSFKAFSSNIITVVHDNFIYSKRNNDMDTYAQHISSSSSNLSIDISFHPSEIPNVSIPDLDDRIMGNTVIASHSSLAAYLMIYQFTNIYLHKDSLFLKYCGPIANNNLFYQLTIADKSRIVKCLFGIDELLGFESSPPKPSDYYKLMFSLAQKSVSKY